MKIMKRFALTALAAGIVVLAATANAKAETVWGAPSLHPAGCSINARTTTAAPGALCP